MKLRCDHRSWIASLAITNFIRKKVFNSLTGFEPRDSSLSPLRWRCSALPTKLWRSICWEQTNLSSSSLTVTGVRREMKLIWTAGIQMKLRCDHRSWIASLAITNFIRKKVFNSSTGFEPIASALALQCSTNWAMKIHMLGVDQFIEFNFTRDRNETWNEVNLNCSNTWWNIEMWSSQL